VRTDPVRGTIERQDGVLTLPAVMRILRRQHGLAPARLIVAGSSGYLAALRTRAEEEGLALRGGAARPRAPHRDTGPHCAKRHLRRAAPCSRLNDATAMVKVTEYVAGERPVVAFDLAETG
jgi:hypothetical protein